ncbi:MAG: hypothetical protein AAF750_11320 [Planctomycetota bacterium]
MVAVRHNPRLSVLLTEDRDRPDEHWTRQLPRLLQPLGCEATVAATGTEALDLARNHPFHAAVIDLATPTGQLATQPGSPSPPGGLWLLQVLNRLPRKPPVIVVNPHAYSQRQVARFLNQALQLGAFSVLNHPVDLNDLLATIARLIQRYHQGQWPSDTNLAPGQ